MKKGTIFILIFTLFAIQSYSQSFSNVDTINVVLSASSFKTVTLATGVKCITVDNSAQSLDLKIGFSPHGSTVDTSNTYTVPAGRVYSFPDRINNYLYLKNGAASTIRLIVDYGAGLPYQTQDGLTTIPSLISSIYTDPDTSGIFRTTLDSVPITANLWFDLATYTSDSTVYLSFIRTFPLTGIIVVPAGSYNKGIYDVSIASYGYVYKKTQTRKHSITINKH